MTVPKAPVHKNRRPVFPHHDVGLARHRLHVEPVAVAVPPQPLPHLQLGLGAFAVDARHDVVSLCRSEAVGHGHLFLLRIINAAMTPGTQPMQVRMNTMSIEPQPRSMTASGEKMMDRMTWRQDMGNNYSMNISVYGLNENNLLRLCPVDSTRKPSLHSSLTMSFAALYEIPQICAASSTVITGF